MRNSEPDKTAVDPWFHQSYLELGVIEDLFGQLWSMGFKGVLNLQHFNEPLLDPRFVQIAMLARSRFPANHIAICTNADFLSEEKAWALDGVLDSMAISLYMPIEEQAPREGLIRSWFSKTYLNFTNGLHVPTHNSDRFDTAGLASRYREDPCFEPGRRLIINHLGECLGCCADMVGHFGLGNIRDYSLADLWWSVPHQQMISDLRLPGGRRKYVRCVTCPQPCWPQAMAAGSLESQGLVVPVT